MSQLDSKACFQGKNLYFQRNLSKYKKIMQIHTIIIVDN